MTKKKHTLAPFSLAFLDIMSCGFGAVVLLFLIIKHNIDTAVPNPVTTYDQSSEVNLLEEEILDGEQNLVKIRNTISDIDLQLVEAQGLADRIQKRITELDGLTSELTENLDTNKLELLKVEIKNLEIQKQKITEDINKSGENIRKVAGDGERAYVTGLKLGGSHMLVLLDVSASMLDETIVNILRRRNMRDERQRTAPKWLKAVNTVDWLSAKFPIDSQYQIYTFNTDTTSIIPNTFGQWLEVKDKTKLDEAVEILRKIVPEDGTNIEKAFLATAKLSPLPDNIYLITDGLPTQGNSSNRGATISGRQRLKLFEEAIKKLPKRVPVNVILSPMEGDPEAAHAFWRLSQITQGSFMSPSEDWP